MTWPSQLMHGHLHTGCMQICCSFLISHNKNIRNIHVVELFLFFYMLVKATGERETEFGKSHLMSEKLERLKTSVLESPRILDFNKNLPLLQTVSFIEVEYVLISVLTYWPLCAI